MIRHNASRNKKINTERTEQTESIARNPRLFLKALAFFGIHLYFSEWIFLFFAVVAFFQQNNSDAGDARRWNSPSFNRTEKIIHLISHKATRQQIDV
jgi:hypothetical protein